MADWGKVAIACRVGQRPDAEFFRSWTKLICGGLRDGDHILTPVIEMQAHFAADSIAKGFLRTDADSILFVDDDMVFEADALDRLRDDVEGWAFDGLMGLCQSRQPPHKPLILRNNPEGEGYLVGGVPPKNEIVDVGILGLGFTLYRREVFEATQEPYFVWSEKGDGEDATFSMKAQANGFRLGVSTRVPIGHRFPITVKYDFDDNDVAFISSGKEELMKR